jgi:flagellar hook-basal body complex protein FliE
MSDTRILSSPSAAINAYARVQNQGLSGAASDPFSGAAQPAGASFGDTLSSALQGVVATGHAADAAAASGISGHGNLTQVVMAVSKAQMSLQATTAIRDKVVQAYQDIMKMSI